MAGLAKHHKFVKLFVQFDVCGSLYPSVVALQMCTCSGVKLVTACPAGAERLPAAVHVWRGRPSASYVVYVTVHACSSTSHSHAGQPPNDAAALCTCYPQESGHGVYRLDDEDLSRRSWSEAHVPHCTQLACLRASGFSMPHRFDNHPHRNVSFR